jgi:hypothetical protein
MLGHKRIDLFKVRCRSKILQASVLNSKPCRNKRYASGRHGLADANLGGGSLLPNDDLETCELNSKSPTFSPTTSPSSSPSDKPSVRPSKSPSEEPSTSPSESPSEVPSESPSESPLSLIFIVPLPSRPGQYTGAHNVQPIRLLVYY